jgi:hypothetical protein
MELDGGGVAEESGKVHGSARQLDSTRPSTNVVSDNIK